MFTKGPSDDDDNLLPVVVEHLHSLDWGLPVQKRLQIKPMMIHHNHLHHHQSARILTIAIVKINNETSKYLCRKPCVWHQTYTSAPSASQGGESPGEIKEVTGGGGVSCDQVDAVLYGVIVVILPLSPVHPRVWSGRLWQKYPTLKISSFIN